MDKNLEPSPEVDLLEQLSAETISLHVVLRIFGDSDDTAALTRARRVVDIYARQGWSNVVHGTGYTKQRVEDWQLGFVLQDQESWLDANSGYQLELTEKGSAAFVEDSAGFFNRLFGYSAAIGRKRKGTRKY